MSTEFLTPGVIAAVAPTAVVPHSMGPSYQDGNAHSAPSKARKTAGWFVRAIIFLLPEPYDTVFEMRRVRRREGQSRKG